MNYKEPYRSQILDYLFKVNSYSSPYSFFFKKIFWRTWVLFLGPLIPLFWTSGDVSSGFQSQSGQPYSSCVEAYMLYVPWDSPLVWHLPTSWEPAWQLSCLFHVPVRHWWNLKPGAIMPPLTVWDQAYALPIELSRLGFKSLFLHVWKTWTLGDDS